MTEVFVRCLWLVAEAPHAADLAFLFMATFFTVVLLSWLARSNSQSPKRPLLLRNRVHD